jgi:hypothetical protein
MATRTHRHRVELSGWWGLLLGAVLFVVFLAATADSTPVAIQKCWDLGGVPIYHWYATQRLADCRFKP